MIFEVFEDVLARLDSDGKAENGNTWNVRVDARLDALAAYYGAQNLRNPQRELIDYSGRATQAAYIYMYAIGRAEFTYQLLKRYRAKLGAPLFPSGTMNVTSIGGGPASELVGLVRYLEDPQNDETVDEILYDVVDKEGDWDELCQVVIDSIPTDTIIIPQFFRVDVTEEADFSDRSLKFDDLVMMSFFVSEICALPQAKAVSKNLESLLRTMKAGAHLFYNDSDAYSFYSYMNRRARVIKGLAEIAEIQDQVVFDYVDPGPTFQAYAVEFDRVPHLKSRALSKLYRRNGQ